LWRTIAKVSCGGTPPQVSVISGFASAMFTIDDGRGKLGGGAFSL
jgi:hypothetical protein